MTIFDERMPSRRQGLASGALKPVIAKTFRLDDIANAHRYMESNEQVGKIVVSV